MDGEDSGVRKQSKRKRHWYDDDSDSDEEELSLKLSDKSVLDCPICFHPLTIPVFQCDNGHITCSSCHRRLESKKCPCCPTILGNIRNRAIEKVLESTNVSCSHKASGCEAKFSYATKRWHEENCAYAPYDCPFKGCAFWGRQTKLYKHLKQHHSKSVITLQSAMSSYCFVSFLMRKAAELAVFLEEGDDGSIVVLDPRTMRIGSINKQAPGRSKDRAMRYSLTSHCKDGTDFMFEPFTLPWREAFAESQPVFDEWFFDKWFGHDGRAISMQIEIYCYNNT